jgi:hypothetical protein
MTQEIELNSFLCLIKATEAENLRPGGIGCDAIEKAKRIRGQYPPKPFESLQLDKICSMGGVPKGDSTRAIDLGTCA